MTNKYNWQEVLDSCKNAIIEGCEPTFTALSNWLEMPNTTLRDGLKTNFNLYSKNLKDIPELGGTTKEEIKKELRLKTTEHDNYLILDIQLAEVRTLDEMLSICDVDLDIWEVERYIVNKWPGYRRNEQIDIKWKDGRIEEGYKKDEGKLTKGALFQVKVWLRRKKPLQPEFIIQPLNLSVTFPKTRPKKKDSKTAVILPDIQFGFTKDLYSGELESFHDRKALDVALQITEHVNPDEVIHLGDILDLPDWTEKFLRTPEMYHTTQPAIIEAAWWLAQFKGVAGNAKHTLLQGNHEERINKAIIGHMKAAYNIKPADELEMPPILSLRRLLCLDSLEINFVEDYPTGEYWLNESTKIIHGNIARSAPGTTAKAIIQDSDISVIQGHIHRIELVTRVVKRQRDSRILFGFIPGCLCRIDGIVPGSETNNWQQGMGIISYTDGYANPMPIYINDGMAIYDGKIFKARDRLKDIRKDTKWKQF